MRPLSSRSLIACLPLIAALGIAGCDKAKAPAGQAGDAAPANVAAAAPTTGAEPDASKVDRSHKGLALASIPFAAPGGAPATLGAYRGKPVLVNLWATWCGPCVKELPTLEALAASPGVHPAVVAISEDNGGDAQVGPFWTARGFKALTPFTDAHMGLMTALQVDVLPTTILFDSSGHEVLRVTGGKDWTGPDAAKLLAEAK